MQNFKSPDGRTFTVVTLHSKKNPNRRGARITPLNGSPYIIPADICALGAGRDAWMRDITFPCNDCGTRMKASELFDELPGCCPACVEKFSTVTPAVGPIIPMTGALRSKPSTLKRNETI